MLTDTYCCLNTTRILLLLPTSEFQNQLSPIARRAQRRDAESVAFCALLGLLPWVTAPA